MSSANEPKKPSHDNNAAWDAEDAADDAPVPQRGPQDVTHEGVLETFGKAVSDAVRTRPDAPETDDRGRPIEPTPRDPAQR